MRTGRGMLIRRAAGRWIVTGAARLATLESSSQPAIRTSAARWICDPPPERRVSEVVTPVHTTIRSMYSASSSSETISGNRWATLVVVCLAQFMVVLDATIVNVALPSIQRGLHFANADLQWVINSYTLMFGGFLLLGGRAADLFGRRRLFILGVAVFSGASLINGLATSSEMLIIGRGLQGLGGALVSPAALSIITTTFAEGSDRTKALGVWSAIAAGGGAFGLLLGGILTDLLSWEWIFFVNVPIGIATAALALRFVPESRAAQRQATADLPGAVSVTAGLVVLVYAIVKAQDFGWGSAKTLGLAAVALALLAAFVVIEQ